MSERMTTLAAPARSTPWGDLQCPICAPNPLPLAIEDGASLRGSCGHSFPILDGIPVLLAPGAPLPPLTAASPGLLDIGVVIPALNEADNLALLLPELLSVLGELGASHEVVIVTGGAADPATEEVVAKHAPAVRIVRQTKRGYGNAIRTGFAAVRSHYVVTMDADLSHRPDFLRAMWAQHENADMIVASRYVSGGEATMPFTRIVLSRILNIFFRRGLRIRVRDLSSGYRLIRTDAVRSLPLRGADFDLVQEILVRAHCEGWRVTEVPFRYEPREHGRSHAALLRFGVAYLRTFGALWKVRNDVGAADYEDIAFDSSIPLQRYWQRRRYRLITQLLGTRRPVLDAGSGSSRLIGALPPGSVAVDTSIAKLRHARKFGTPLAVASAESLPFAAGTFPCVVCAAVLEHLPQSSPLLDELVRVTQSGGRVIVTTPDSSSRLWSMLRLGYRRIVQGHSAAQVSRHTRDGVIRAMEKRGCTLDDSRSILGAEMVLAFRKEA